MSTLSPSNSQQASRSFPHERVSIVVRRTLSTRWVLVLRVDSLRLIIPSAAEESLDRLWRFSRPHRQCFRNVAASSTVVEDPRFSQAPESAATYRASPLLSAVVDVFLLDAGIGHQPSLPRNHDAAPLTLSRSASPAQSESPHVNN